MSRLFHFSDDDAIAVFRPRPVSVPAKRAEGMDWLNGPLVWAIDEWHQPMYLFPRDCPRILIWPTEHTSPQDLARHFGDSKSRIIAYVEDCWLSRLRAHTLYRYELPEETFQSLQDAGMWVSRHTVRPRSRTRVEDLVQALDQHDVELRPIASLVSLGYLWTTTLHASGIRLRNSAGWRG